MHIMSIKKGHVNNHSWAIIIAAGDLVCRELQCTENNRVGLQRPQSYQFGKTSAWCKPCVICWHSFCHVALGHLNDLIGLHWSTKTGLNHLCLGIPPSHVNNGRFGDHIILSAWFPTFRLIFQHIKIHITCHHVAHWNQWPRCGACARPDWLAYM